MNDPCIICVAITGSVPTKKDNPAVPISISEQVESTQECFELGASIAHCHVRNDDGTPSIDPDKYSRLKEGIEKYCPGMIINFLPVVAQAMDLTGKNADSKTRYGFVDCWLKQFSNKSL